MITFELAMEIINHNTNKIDAEIISFENSLNRVIQEDIFSDMDMPPFDKSAMDGYACRMEDLKNELEVIELIPAGYFPKKKIDANQCAKIMTGAKIPEGADCVIMVEQTQIKNEKSIIFIADKTAPNICKQGEDIKRGELVLKAGTKISPRHFGALAMVGAVKIKVNRKVRVGIIATGDELVEPSENPNNSQIRNTNSWQLYSQCIKEGYTVNYYGIVKDDSNEIKNKILTAKEENDLILLTGGVSMGDFDFVPALLKECGFNLLFEKVAIQPGKPTVFGKSEDNKYVFGLPGNPVSSFIIFEVFVKAFLAEFTGEVSEEKKLILPLKHKVHRKKAERLGWIPVRIDKDGKVSTFEYHGSAHINAISYADGIISVPVGINELEEGTLVNVRQI